MTFLDSSVQYAQPCVNLPKVLGGGGARLLDKNTCVEISHEVKY